MDPVINLDGDLVTLTLNDTRTMASQAGIIDLANVFYYVILLPFGVVGNSLSLVVSFCLLRGDSERRFSADMYCAFLATVDLLCIAAIHAPTIALLLSSTFTSVPPDLCRFQAAATTIYLNVEFVLQIAMSIDRYSALTRPMQYKATSQNMPCLLLVLVICISLAYALISHALPSTNRVTLTSWRLCTHVWQVSTGVDNLKVFFVFLWFVGGLALFIRSNLALVCVLCRYNQQRSSAVLQEIARVKLAIEKRQTEAANRKRQTTVVVQSRSSERLTAANNSSTAKKRKTSATILTQPGDGLAVGPPSSPLILITGPSEADLCHCHHTDDNKLCYPTTNLRNDFQSQPIGKSQQRHVTLSSSNPCLVSSNADLEESMSCKVKVRRQTFPLALAQLTSHCNGKYEAIASVDKGGNASNTCDVVTAKHDGIHTTHNADGHCEKQLTNQTASQQTKVNGTSRDGEHRVTLVHVVSQESRVSDTGHLVTQPLYDRSVSNTSARSARRFHENVKRLLHRLEVKARRQKKEILLARLIVICSCVFVATLLPYAVVSACDALGVPVSSLCRQVATRCVFLNVILNPIFHGLCRKKYRAGYDYLAQVCCYNVSCGFFAKPQDDKVFYDCRKKRRLQQKLERRITNNNRAPPPPVRKPRPLLPVTPSQYDQPPPLDEYDRPPTSVAKQQTGAASGDAGKAFHPSPKLHDLFNRHEATAARAAAKLSPSSSSNVLSIDYDALVFGDQQLFDNLRHVCSLLQHMPASDSEVTPEGSSGDEEGEEKMGGDCIHLTVPQIGLALSRSFDAHERRRLSAVSSHHHGDQVHSPTDARLSMSFSLSASNFTRVRAPKT